MVDFYGINTRNRQERMKRFWICWAEYTDGGTHYRHYNLENAQMEAERLAKLPGVQGRTVYVFECVGKCRVEQAPVKWEVPR